MILYTATDSWEMLDGLSFQIKLQLQPQKNAATKGSVYRFFYWFAFFYDSVCILWSVKMQLKKV